MVETSRVSSLPRVSEAPPRCVQEILQRMHLLGQDGTPCCRVVETATTAATAQRLSVVPTLVVAAALPPPAIAVAERIAWIAAVPTSPCTTNPTLGQRGGGE